MAMESGIEINMAVVNINLDFLIIGKGKLVKQQK
jgi:hypothetical protein